MDLDSKIEAGKSLKLSEIRELINKLNFNNLTANIYSDTVFTDFKDKIVLIQSDDNPMTGHYILIYKNDKNTIMYFDPSGTKPLELWNRFNLDKEFQDPEKLYEYLQSGIRMAYNDVNYQSKYSELCGIMCLVRYYFKNLNSRSFRNLIRDFKKKLLETLKKPIPRYEEFDRTFIELFKAIYYQC